MPFLLLLSGCIVSDRVSAIGQRIYVVRGIRSDTPAGYHVDIEEYEAVSPEDQAGTIPYTHEMTLGRKVQDIDGYVAKADLKNHGKNKTIAIEFEGSQHVFLVPNGELKPESIDNAVMTGKKWYFLPAQGLQLLAMPTDLAIDAIIAYAQFHG